MHFEFTFSEGYFVHSEKCITKLLHKGFGMQIRQHIPESLLQNMNVSISPKYG